MSREEAMLQTGAAPEPEGQKAAVEETAGKPEGQKAAAEETAGKRGSQTWRQAYLYAVRELASCKIAEPETDAKVLLKYAGGLSDTDYLLCAQDRMPQEAAQRFSQALERRKQHVPVQHITGSAWFFGYEFLVNEHVLIPRMDTEILADRAISFIGGKGAANGLRALDLCTGSGILAIVLKKEFPDLEVWAGDISAQALAVARENARRQGVCVNWYEADLFDGARGRFDLIVSNPPYISSEEIGQLDEEVRLHDPLQALDGGADGLLFYRRIAKEAGAYLKAGGGLFLEIGYDQARQTQELLRGAGYEQVHSVKDLAGRDRVTCGIWSRKDV